MKCQRTLAASDRQFDFVFPSDGYRERRTSAFLSRVFGHTAPSSGFTLIELLAVIVILAVLTAMFLPRAPSRAAMTLTARAQQLASDLRYVQTISMTNGQRYCLTLSPTSPYTGYSMTTASSTCATAILHPGNVAQPVGICNGVGCITAPALPSGYIQFDGLGQPYSAPTTLLASNAVFTLSEDGLTQTVTLSPITGRVTVP